MWSIENETMHCIGYWMDLYDSNIKNLKRVGMAVKSVDPTRPVDFEGDGDLDGTWEVCNLHYPRQWWMRSNLPESAFWLVAGTRTALDIGFMNVLEWDRNKPLYFGENGLGCEISDTPHDLTLLAGPSVYNVSSEKDALAKWMDADDRGHAFLLEGERDAEVACITSQYGGTWGPAHAAALLPIRSFIRERNSRFFSGEKVVRHVVIHHDVLGNDTVEFQWTLKEATKKLARGAFKKEMAPSELLRREIEFTIPVVQSRTEIELETRILCRGRQRFREVFKYSVFPNRPLEIPAGMKVALLGKVGQTADTLAAAGLQFTRLATYAPIEDFVPVKPYKLLIIGENGLDRMRLGRIRSAVAAFCKKGGVVFCLRQKIAPDDWLPPVGLRADVPRVSTICWPRVGTHPILEGLTAEDLRFWVGDSVVSRGDFLKSPRLGWLPLVDSGGLGGLRWASLVEIAFEKGAIILCQMDVLSKLDKEPSARMIMQNVLNWAKTREPCARVGMARLCKPGSDMELALSRLGVSAAACHTDMRDVKILLVSADLGLEHVPAITAFAGKGGTVLLHGLTPYNLVRWNSLLGERAHLEEVNVKHANLVKSDGLVEGLSPTEAWWSHNGPACWGWKEVGDVVEVGYAFRGGVGAIEYVSPGALVVLPVGGGQVIVDQVRWDAPEAPPERALLYAAILLTNLQGGCRK